MPVPHLQQSTSEAGTRLSHMNVMFFQLVVENYVLLTQSTLVQLVRVRRNYQSSYFIEGCDTKTN